MHVHELGNFRPLLMSKAFGFELELPIIKKKRKNKCINWSHYGNYEGLMTSYLPLEKVYDLEW